VTGFLYCIQKTQENTRNYKKNTRNFKKENTPITDASYLWRDLMYGCIVACFVQECREDTRKDVALLVHGIQSFQIGAEGRNAFLEATS
jgi:hypothetical protein